MSLKPFTFRAHVQINDKSQAVEVSGMFHDSHLFIISSVTYPDGAELEVRLTLEQEQALEYDALDRIHEVDDQLNESRAEIAWERGR